MREKTSDFVSRMAGEVKAFTGHKSWEVRDGIKEMLQEGTNKVLSAAEETAYPMALNLVAKRYGITQEEAEQRLSRSLEPVVTASS